MATDDMLMLCARCGLRLFDDYIVRAGDIVVPTEAGQRKLEQAAAGDEALARQIFAASGVEIEKALHHGRLPRAARRRLRRLWQRDCTLAVPEQWAC
jgi:hypothetical protein